MQVYNVVRFKVKAGEEAAFLDAHSNGKANGRASNTASSSRPASKPSVSSARGPARTQWSPLAPR